MKYNKLEDKILKQMEYEQPYITELFGPEKYFNGPLTSDERKLLEEYIHDKNNPQWKVVLINNEKSIYEVSNTGLIRNSISKNILSSSQSKKTSYWHINLRRIENGFSKTYTFLNHRLVAEAFIPNPENKPQVNHINGIKTCNWYKNLEWVTARENTLHAIRNNLMPVLRGEQRSKLYTNNQIEKVCELLEKGSLYKDIEKISGVKISTINNIAKGKDWKHISSKYNIKINKKPQRSNEELNKLNNLFNSGFSNNEIFHLLNYKTEADRSFISYHRNKLNSISTTIESIT